MAIPRTAFRAARLSLVLIGAVAPARADQLCHTASVPLTQVPYDVEVPIPRFDTAFGTLQQVSVTIELTVITEAAAENTDAAAYTITVTRGATASAAGSDGVPFVSDTLSATSTHALSAYDGILDFGGTSGVTLAPLTLTGGPIAGSRNDPGALALFAGPPGNPGGSGLRARALGVSVISGAGNLVTHFAAENGFTQITVCYEYAPRITSLCAGDGSGTACPCANSGGAGEGCANSTGAGSLLAGTGGASIAADSLTIRASVPGTTSTLFLQGTLAIGGGSGVVFGDGLRCVGGSVLRLGSGPATAGLAQYPRPGDASISVRGLVPAGSTRFYQAWYRNPPSHCTPAVFNLSNALRVEWGA